MPRKSTLARLGLAALVLVAASAAVVFALPGSPGKAADHLDAPAVQKDGRLDINDVYAFQSPANPRNTVLIMTVNPVAGVLSPTTLHPSASYEFLIDSDGDAKPDQKIKAKFGKPNGAGVQKVHIEGDDDIEGEGKTGQVIRLDEGGKAQVTTYDDPFFFDLAAFRAGLAFCPGGVGTNFFKGLNVSAIVVEVPSAALLGEGDDDGDDDDGDDNGGTADTMIGVWARTVLNGKQIDRMARPAINTVFIPSGMKDGFNLGKPQNDQRDFRDEVVATLMALGNSPATSNALADILLPDILTFDTASAAGFLNGRRLADDVIDAELGIISGGAIPTDCVANDSVFSTSFPYLAPPN